LVAWPGTLSGGWARGDLNLRPLPYQVLSARVLSRNDANELAVDVSVSDRENQLMTDLSGTERARREIAGLSWGGQR
jgi:hypothetical protein